MLLVRSDRRKSDALVSWIRHAVVVITPEYVVRYSIRERVTARPFLADRTRLVQDAMRAGVTLRS